MQVFKSNNGSKLVKLVLITVLLLSVLIVAVLAEDYTVTTSTLPSDIGVGDSVELSVSFKNNTSDAVNGMLMRVPLPKSFLDMVSNSVRIKVNDGAWNQALSAPSNTVRDSQDYKYNYDSSGVLSVSLGNVAPGETVTVGYTVNITSMDTSAFMYRFYRNNNYGSMFKSSMLVRIVLMMADVKPVVEKTSINLNRSGNKANVGDIIEYTIKATNNTTREKSLWTNVSVTDVLPDGVTFVSSSVTIDDEFAAASRFSYNAATRTLRVFLDDLGPMATSTVTFCASIDADAHGKTISNSVLVSGLDREDNNSEKSDEDDDGEGHTVNREFRIAFHGNATGVQGTMNPQTVTENTPTPLNRCDFTLTGSVFIGWSLTSGGPVVYSDRENITVTGNVDLYAQWTTDACTINFHKNALDAVGNMTPQTAARNLPTTLKENTFTYPGHTFAGWSENPDATVATYADKAVFTPTADETDLYAVWVNAKYTITFAKNAPNATGDMPPQEVEANVPNKLNKNQFVLAGYDFAGWSTDPNATTAMYDDEAYITPTGDMRLYAVWKNPTYTITFDPGFPDVVGTMPQQVVEGNKTATLNRNQYSRPGYLFAGWRAENGVLYGDQATFIPTGDLTLTAEWTNDTYTIRFYKNSPDATGTMTDQIVVSNVPNTLKKNQFVLIGYTFMGWSTDPNATTAMYGDEGTITPTGNMDLYAVWGIATYTITFDKNAFDAVGDMTPQSVTANRANTLKANTFTRPDYSFRGWSTDRYATVPTYGDQASIIPTGDMTLYAVWGLTNCTITFDKNAADATGTMAQQVITAGVNSTINANGFARANYYFRGWSTSPNGEVVYSDRGYITLTDHITLYAIWGADPCTITFHKNSNAAMGVMTPQVVSPNVAFTLKKCEFENPGYFIEGWSTNPNATTWDYRDQEVIIAVDNMDLYAIWTPAFFTEDHIQYIKGYPDGSVRADNNITRAEAVAIFFRLIDYADKDVPIADSFADVPSGEWFTQYVAFMARMGIVNGYPDGNFRPNQPITRAEFAKVAARFDSLDFPENNAFTDVPTSHWANLYVNSAYEKGWINGYSDGLFAPERNISRAEVMALVNRMTKRKIDDAAFAQILNPYNDITLAHWAYRDVIEASKEHDYLRDANETEYWTVW